jgi:hypothetical protein
LKQFGNVDEPFVNYGSRHWNYHNEAGIYLIGWGKEQDWLDSLPRENIINLNTT